MLMVVAIVSQWCSIQQWPRVTAGMGDEHLSLRLQRVAFRRIRDRFRTIKNQVLGLCALQNRQDLQLLAMTMAAWKRFNDGRLEYLATFDGHHHELLLSQALPRWCRWTSLHIHDSDRDTLATEFHTSRKLRLVLQTWYQRSSVMASGREAIRIGAEHAEVYRKTKSFTILRRETHRLRRARQMVRRAEEYHRNVSLHGGMIMWGTNGRFLFLFEELRARSLARRVLRKWRHTALRQADLRAFSMALTCKEESYLRFKYFHALSLWSTRRARLRFTFNLVATMTEYSTLNRHWNQWAAAVTTRHRDREIKTKASTSDTV